METPDDPKAKAVEVGKKRRGRPPGVKNRAKPQGVGPVKLRQVVEGFFTAEVLQKKIFPKLSPNEVSRLVSSLEPRERAVADSGGFTLVISGLSTYTCAKCGYHHEGAAERGGPAANDQPGNDGDVPADAAGRSWREDARKQGVSVPAEGPKPKAERIQGSDDSPPDPPKRIRLRHPDGSFVSFDPPDPPGGPYGPGEIP